MWKFGIGKKLIRSLSTTAVNAKVAIYLCWVSVPSFVKWRWLPPRLLKKIVMLLKLSQFSPLCLPAPSLCPPDPTNSQSIPTQLSMSMGHSSMFFEESLPLLSNIPPASPLATVSLFHVSMSLVLFCSLVFCSLDSSYKWHHMVFVFHLLAYFT